MREHFPLYYHLTEEEKQKLFKSKDCYFVFDTNALLDIYRLGKDTAGKILKLLEKFRDRIIIPKQVAKEYHDNMLNVITEICREYANFLEKNTAEVIVQKLMDMFNAKNSPSIKRKMNKYIEPAIKRFLKDVRGEQEYMLNQFRNWELQNVLSDALGEMLLPGFTEEELAKLEEEGDERYSKKVPPGYEDEAKDSNKYGDFIIWKEMLRFAKEKSCSIIFVSRDLKKDWFQVLHGMTCGPCQELLEEFKLYSPKGDFHIYTLDQVISFANEGDNVLNKNDISELKEIVATPVIEKRSIPVVKSVAPEKEITPTDDKSEGFVPVKSATKGSEIAAKST